MSILRAMYSGVSGIGAEGTALGIIGDNIANGNTVGFKSQRAIFQDMLGRAVGSGVRTAGSGVEVADTQQIFTQGTLASTGVSTDLAINGDGFFVVRGSVGGVDGNFYSRAGQFHLDASGNLVNSNSMRVQGYQVQPDGTMGTSVTSIEVPAASVAPKSTTTVNFTANLDSNAVTPTAPWDINNPGQTSNFTTSTTVYDSLGNSHTVDLYFRKTAANTWEYHAVVPGDEVQPPVAGNFEVGSRALTFDSDGKLTTVAPATPMVFNFNGATPGQQIELGFGDNGLDGLSQYGSPSTVSSQSQNGYSSGDLAGVNVDNQGVVSGLYSNGQKIVIGQLVIAKFRSNEGLGRAGQNLWTESDKSGAAVMGGAGTGGRGLISSGVVEQSNVDMAGQLVDMITHQRAYQANSKTISTADQMLEQLMNIKR